MKKLTGAVACLILVFMFSQSPALWAEVFNFQKLLNGTITDVRSDAITLAPSKAEQIEAKTIELKVNEKTQLKDVGLLTNLKKGDGVYVKYTEDQGQKTAVEISKNAETIMTK